MARRFVTDEERRREPPEPKVIGHCHVCRGEIYQGERYAVAPDGKMIHCASDKPSDCLDDEWSNLQADEKAEMLGYEVVR